MGSRPPPRPPPPPGAAPSAPARCCGPLSSQARVPCARRDAIRPRSRQSPVLHRLRFGLWGRTCRLSQRDVSRSPEPHTEVLEVDAVTAAKRLCRDAKLVGRRAPCGKPVATPCGAPGAARAAQPGDPRVPLLTPPHPQGQGREAPQPPWPQ